MSAPGDVRDSANTSVRIQGGIPLRGAVHVGPDLQVLECALALAALGDGSSQLQGILPCAQLDSAMTAWNALGARCSCDGTTVFVEGAGLYGLTAPRGALAAERSPQLLAQLAAVLSAQSFGTRVTLRASRFEWPVEHLVGALRARGGQIAGTTGPSGELAPPVAVAPLLSGEQPQAIDVTLPYADAAAKTALLLSGLYASGATTVSEPHVSSDTCERMLVALGVPLRRIGSVVALDAPTPGQKRRLPALGTVPMPGSAEVAQYLAVLASWLPGSDITLRNVSVNPSRAGLFDVLRSWGGAFTAVPRGDAALREPVADIRVRHAKPRGGVVDAEILVAVGDALPALALLGPVSQRGVRMYDLSALAARADPQWLRLDAMFRAFGLMIVRTPEELQIPSQALPPPRPRPTGDTHGPRRVDAQDDPTLALLACTLALASPGETVVEHAAQPLRAVHPGFVPAAAQLGASIELV